MRYLRCARDRWSFLVEEQTGFVREVCWGGERLVAAVYSAVRGVDWSTYPVVISDLRWGDSWCSWWTHAHGAPFGWKTEVEIGSDLFRMSIDGTPSETFQTCRTGLCILHPLSVCGQTVTVRHVDGSEELSEFPNLVAPHQPFVELAGMRYRTPSGVQVDITLEGEVFETEDQRNWSDASFKTYCHRLGDGKPYTMKKGQRVRQEVRVHCTGEPSLISSPRELEAPMPALSVWLDPAEANAVSALQMAGFTRVATDAVETLREIAGIAVDFRVGAKSISRLQPVAPPASGSTLWLVSDRWTPDVEEAVHHVKTKWQPLGWEMGYGSAANFAELNRSRPPQGVFDWLSTGASPQVHTFDAWSILQNADSFASIGATMRTFGRDVRWSVFPLRFESRFREDDPRADSSLAAAYLILALASCAEGEFGCVVTGRAAQMLTDGSPVGAVFRDILSVAPHSVRRSERGDVQAVWFVGAQGSVCYEVNPFPQEHAGIPPFSWRKKE